MRARETPAPAAAVALALALSAVGCAPPAGPRPIALGTPCAGCGMDVRDLRFACERHVGTDWRVYDSIECLIRDAGASTTAGATTSRPGATWLADYDHQSLHAAESLWVVRGEFASPMGGGFAAFLDLAAADSIAATTRGRVDRLAAFMPAPVGVAR